MRVDETGKYVFMTEIDLAAESRSEMQNVIIGPDCDEAPIADRNGLGARIFGIYRPEIPVVEDHVRFGAGERECSKRAHGEQKVAACGGHRNLFYSK